MRRSETVGRVDRARLRCMRRSVRRARARLAADYAESACVGSYTGRSASGRDDESSESLLRGRQFLALHAGVHHAAVVAQQLHLRGFGTANSASGRNEPRSTAAIGSAGVAALAGPAIQREAAFVGGRTGHDQIASLHPFDAADAAPAEVEFERFTELRAFAVDDLRPDSPTEPRGRVRPAADCGSRSAAVHRALPQDPRC